MKRKKRLYLLSFWCLSVSLTALGYPYVSNWFREYAVEDQIAEYGETVQTESASDLAKAREEADQYNGQLSGDTRKGKQTVSVASYGDILAVTQDIIGYLEIPKIRVYLPIYHGDGEEILEKGVGHVPGSSMPVGGPSTHSILAGHTGLPSARLFTELDQLEEGDLFYIHVLEDILAYKVDQISVVLPEDTEKTQIVKGKDYVTLLTCVPYGVNSHRLLVRGERTAYDQKDALRELPETKRFSARTLQWCMGAGLVLVFLGVSFRILHMPPEEQGEETDSNHHRKKKERKMDQ